MKLDYKVFSGTSSQYLAKNLFPPQLRIRAMNTTRFSDGEFAVSYEEDRADVMSIWYNQPSPIPTT